MKNIKTILLKFLLLLCLVSGRSFGQTYYIRDLLNPQGSQILANGELDYVFEGNQRNKEQYFNDLIYNIKVQSTNPNVATSLKDDVYAIIIHRSSMTSSYSTLHYHFIINGGAVSTRKNFDFGFPQRHLHRNKIYTYHGKNVTGAKYSMTRGVIDFSPEGNNEIVNVGFSVDLMIADAATSFLSVGDFGWVENFDPRPYNLYKLEMFK